MDSEAELIGRYRDTGDRQALDALFRTHVGRVYRTARRILRNDAEAEDVTQATFLAALRGLSSLRTGERFSPWLCAIAVRLARKSLRSSGAESRRRAAVAPRPASEPPMHELDRVMTAVGELPEEYRLPILLRHCDGLSYDDIGAALGIPTGTVGTHIHRGLEKLRAALSATGPALSVAALTALLATSGTAEASSRTVEAVSRLAHASSRPFSPTKGKASAGIAVAAGVLLVTIAATRPRAPEASAGIPRPRVTVASPSAVAAPTDSKPPEVEDPAPPAPGRSAVDERIARNEQAIPAGLHQISTAEADFRANDRDGNQFLDFWVGDVSGLYRTTLPEEPGTSIKLIEHAVAAADAAPVLQSPGMAPPLPAKPYFGYWFRSLPVSSAKDGRSRSEFAFTAYPAEYGLSGRRTFVINENNMVFGKDLGGNAAGAWPADVELATWEKEVQKIFPSSAPTPKMMEHIRVMSGRRGLGCGELRTLKMPDLATGRIICIFELLGLDDARSLAFEQTHARLLECARSLEVQRARKTVDGDRTVIDIPAFPQEGQALLNEWARELDTLLDADQKRKLENYRTMLFPVGLGQRSVSVTIRRTKGYVEAVERSTTSDGEEVTTPLGVDADGVPFSCRHLLR